ncbi:MAG: thioredoxin domain-containing protein [Vitreimonas sp.]
MSVVGRRQLILGGASLLALAACSGGASGSSSSAPSPDDMAIGAANAPVTLIEYASVTCPHCKEWHDTVWAQFKTHYVDTGRVRFVMREMATPAGAAAVAVAGFQIARCGGAAPEQYMARVDELFRQQEAIFATGTMAGVRAKLMEIGVSTGLTEAQVDQCIADEGGGQRIQRIADQADRDFQITGTPTFILNGHKIDDPGVLTYEGLSRLLDQALAGH